MIFRRALLRELTQNTVLVFVVLLAMVFTQLFVKLLGAAASGSLPADGVMGILAFTALTQLPTLLSATVFIAVLLTLSRAWRDSEMVVWMSAGQSLAGWLRPVMQFALPLVALIAVIAIGVSPWALQKRAEYQRVLESRDELSAVAPGMFQERRRDGMVFFVESINALSGKINKVFIHRDERGLDDTTFASTAYLYEAPDAEKYLLLENGRRTQGPPDNSAWETIDFERFGVRLENYNAQALPIVEKAKPTSLLLRTPTRIGQGELFWRFSLPLFALLLVFVAIPLSFVNPRLGRGYNLTLAILIFAVYMQLINILQGQITLGHVPLWGSYALLHGVALLGVIALFYWRYQGATFWKTVRFWERDARGATA